MELRTLIYPFIVLLAYGNQLYSGASSSPTFCTVDSIAQEGTIVALEKTATFDLLGYFEVENNTEGNEDDDHTDDNLFGPQDNAQNGWLDSIVFPLFQTRQFIASLPLYGKAAPLYLLNRVFRI